MKTNLKNQVKSELVVLQGKEWLKRLRIAGNCVASVMSSLENLVKEKTTKSLYELSKFAGAEIIKQGCMPTFLNYKGFPSEVCISVNHQLVHGIATDYKLQEGDVVSFDFGATFEGAIADAAKTFIYGEPKSKEHIIMIEVCQNALEEGIKSARAGNRIGAIGNAIYKYTKNKGFRVIEKYGGHSITDNTPHAPPFVPNRCLSNEGIRIQPGLTLAIEPMIVPFRSSIETKIATDGWTVYTEEIGVHVEKTIYIHEDKIEIITNI